MTNSLSFFISCIIFESLKFTK